MYKISNTRFIQTEMLLSAILILGLLVGGCQNKKQESTKMMNLQEKIVGQYDEKDVKEFTISNSSGVEVKLTSYGAIAMSLLAPDRDGKLENVVLGFEKSEGYWTEPYSDNCCYLGSIVGRYGNRIAKGTFELNNEKYSMAINNGPNSLHGGIKGFDKVVWDAKSFSKEEEAGVVFSYLSKDGEEGYPGNFTIKVKYTLTQENELKIDYTGTIDKACPVNVTHHGYFNLTGGAKRDILDHQMMIKADRYTVVDETLIPTGELRPVIGTPMDFNKATKIGERIADVEGGYDHNYVLSDDVMSLRKVVEVFEPVSGRMMEVFTTEPGVQFYSGNFLNGILTGSGGVKYNQHWGFCLETQHFPDSPNQETFPSTVLEPGEVYEHSTVYRFGTRD